MKKTFPVVLLSALGVVALSCGKPNLADSRIQERWNSANEPNLMNVGSGLERNLAKLPLSASMKTKPWADTYWPSNQGGLATRWNTLDPQPFVYVPPSLAELKRMSSQAIAGLSPAEKYDILTGRYDYPTVRSERARTSPQAASWEGLCHGWAPAAQLFEEPRPVTVSNADGISIPFGSSDVKGLLSYYQGQIATNIPTRFLASRCNEDIAVTPGSANLAQCRDVNAGAFHIVLANHISKNQPFVADVTRDLQVWNQPIYSFESVVQREQAPSRGAAAGTVKEVVFKTRMVYGIEIEPQWRALGDQQALAQKDYEYRLELSANGEILGGEWLTDERPDFLWSQGKPGFQGSFAKLGELYAASIQGAVPTPVPTAIPTAVPTAIPTAVPTAIPTAVPTAIPTAVPTAIPTAVPTAIPTAVPTAIPTAVPTAIPTAVPTAIPTAVPTAIPTPAGTVIPLPTRTPVPSDQLKGYCPSGWELRKVPGATNVGYCAQGSKVLGPMSEKMIDVCLNAFNEDCYETNWNEATYLKFRGTAVCILGTQFDEQTGYCVEDDAARKLTVFGPFTKELVERCQKANGGDACLTMRWSRDFTLKLMLR